MAFVVKGQGARVYRSALANAGPDAMSAFQRQRDCYVLALAGSRDCKRLWNDYVAEAPEMARLVVTDVQNERRQGAEVSAVLDKRLADAERLVTKNRKTKVSKSAKTKVSKRRLDEIGIEAARVTALESDLNSSDSWTREMAYKMLSGSRGQ